MTPEEITALRERIKRLEEDAETYAYKDQANFDLRSRIVTLESDNASLTKERDRAYQGSEAQTQDQLAAAQATNKKLAGYLWKFGRHFEDCGWQMNKPCNCGFEAANSTANDTTALDARLAAERDRCAKVCYDYGADIRKHPMTTNGAWQCAAAIRSMT